MKVFLALIFMTTVTFAQNQNKLSESIQKIIKDSGFLGFIFEKGSCPEIFEHLPDQPAEPMFAKAYELRAKNKDCESARYFHEIRRQWTIRPHYKMAWKELIMSYLLANDYIAAINEGNMFIEQMPGTPEIEEVHLAMINAVNMMMMSAGSERAQEWTEYALGISNKQNDENPYLKNLSFKSFLEKYPNSSNAALVKGMMAHARNNHAEYHLKIGNYYAIRVHPQSQTPNYPAAIMRYDIVLKWGPVVSSYTQALYSTVDVLFKMADVIKTNAISEDTLKEWLQIDSNRDKKSIDRLTLTKQIYEQITELQKKMNSETITQDIWTQKTNLLIEEKQK